MKVENRGVCKVAMVVLKVENRGVCKVAPTGAEMQDVVEASMEKATEQAVKAMVVMKVENRGVCKVAPTGAEMQAVVEAIDLASMVMAAQEARWAVCIAAGA